MSRSMKWIGCTTKGLRISSTRYIQFHLSEVLRVAGMAPTQSFSELEKLRHRSPSPMTSSNFMSNVGGAGFHGWNGHPQERLGVPRGMTMDWQGVVCLLEYVGMHKDDIRREVQTMILIDHPNFLLAHCSFTTGHNLWVVMPYMAEGSCLHIMKSAYTEGFEEPVIATLLCEVLKALVYLIHRDVKAGNILVDSNGTVKLGDFGVYACMFDTGDRQRSRNTFVGTPCWMAPEVMQQMHGYDFKADIWSFGITALEQL